MPLRSAGFLSVTWTAVLCAVKISGNSSAVQEIWVYIGWGVIAAISLPICIYSDYRERAAWFEHVQRSGLLRAAKEARELFLELTIERALRPMDNTYYGIYELNKFEKNILSARSIANVARLLLNLEDVVVLERLSIGFLQRRSHWISSLKFIKDSPASSENGSS